MASFHNEIVVCFIQTPKVTIMAKQDPVVQSIVSLTISLRHKFVKQISAKVTNTLLFFVEKNVSAKDSHIFFNKK